MSKLDGIKSKIAKKESDYVEIIAPQAMRDVAKKLIAYVVGELKTSIEFSKSEEALLRRWAKVL